MGVITGPADDDDEPGAVEVWPQVADAFRLFVALETQWERAGMAGVRTGLNYLKIEPVARLMGLDATPETFRFLQIAERTALKIFHEQAEKA